MHEIHSLADRMLTSGMLRETILALTLLACDGNKTPTCSNDTECRVVDVFCGGRSAEHRAVAYEVQARYEAEAMVSDCRRNEWASPERLEARCRVDACHLEVLHWPAYAACAAGSQCVVVEDPCHGNVPVAASRANKARRVIASAERAETCRARRPVLIPGPATCVDGYCRF